MAEYRRFRVIDPEGAGIDPEGASGLWYREAGSGMGATLNTAVRKDAYTLTDRGTWLSYRDKSPLKVLYEGDSRLFNPYGIIAINQQRYPGINRQGAEALIAWFISSAGQKLIDNYRIGDLRLFTPSANKGRRLH